MHAAEVRVDDGRRRELDLAVLLLQGVLSSNLSEDFLVLDVVAAHAVAGADGRGAVVIQPRHGQEVNVWAVGRAGSGQHVPGLELLPNLVLAA